MINKNDKYYSVVVYEKHIACDLNLLTSEQRQCLITEELMKTMMAEFKGIYSLFSTYSCGRGKLEYHEIRTMYGYAATLDFSIPYESYSKLSKKYRDKLSDDLVPISKLLGDDKCYCCGKEHDKSEGE